MIFENLTKNDVLFCESKGSKVLKLIEKVGETWIGRDIFSNQNFELTNSDQFKLVNRNRKVTPLSLVKLFESKDSQTTLTEKEVLIVDYIKDNYDPDELEEMRISYKNGTIGKSNLLDFQSMRRYLNLTSGYSQDNLIQYVYCAIENINKTITTSTQIKRFQEFTFYWNEETIVTEFTTYRVGFSAIDRSDAEKIIEVIKDDFWSYDPESTDSDYGDREFVKMSNPEIYEDKSTKLVIR